MADAGTAVDAGSGSTDAGLPPNCELIFDRQGLVHESTASNLKQAIALPRSSSSSWKRIDVSLDVYLAQWTPKQGMYEVFSFLRAAADGKYRWVSGAIGMVALIGPNQRQTVTVANLNLAGAAAPDGRRIARSYSYQTAANYHFASTYDVPNDRRGVTVSTGGAQVASVMGLVSAPVGTPPVTSIEVPRQGFTLKMGGQDDPALPDASTLGWRFSNVRVVGCR